MRRMPALLRHQLRQPLWPSAGLVLQQKARPWPWKENSSSPPSVKEPCDRRYPMRSLGASIGDQVAQTESGPEIFCPDAPIGISRGTARSLMELILSAVEGCGVRWVPLNARNRPAGIRPERRDDLGPARRQWQRSRAKRQRRYQFWRPARVPPAGQARILKSSKASGQATARSRTCTESSGASAWSSSTYVVMGRYAEHGALAPS